MTLKFFIVLIFISVGVRTGECASLKTPVRRDVPSAAIMSGTDENLESIESLATSTILMDHTSSQLPLQNQVFNKILQSVLPSKPMSKPDNEVYNVGKLSEVKGGAKIEIEMKQVEEDLRSPLHMAQCREACLKKITNKNAKTETALASKLPKETIAKPWKQNTDSILQSSAEKQKLSTCFNDSKECRWCWKKCSRSSSSSAANIYELIEKVGDNSSNKSEIDKTFEETEHLKPFEVRVVSLTYQESLVIADLRWNELEENPEHDYLVTWEVAGGGLKGHLVTDSTSVSLSLWPDTTYTVQVEIFQPSFLDSDGDGEHPTTTDRDSPASLKSLILTVDTSVALFPLETPSGLLSDKSDKDSDEDKVSPEEDDDLQSYEFIGKVLGVLFASIVLVLLVLFVVLFLLVRLRRLFTSGNMDIQDEFNELSGSGCFSSCFAVEESDSSVLVSRSNLNTEESTSSLYSTSRPHVFSISQCSSKGKSSCGTLEHGNVPVFSCLS